MTSSCSSCETGNLGFDFWKDEFSSKVQEIEMALHHGNDPVEICRTNDLVRQATVILPNLLREIQRVSKTKDPALWQEMMDIYEACKMQLETYQLLNKEATPSQNQESVRCSTKENPQNSTLGNTKTLQPITSQLWNNNTAHENTRRDSSYGIKGERAPIRATTHGRVNGQNSRLRDALRSLRESEEIALEITGELKGQRETLQHTQSSMSSMKDVTEQARGLLKSMNKKWWMKW